MTKQEIYKILRYKPEFVKNMYFPYAWLVIEEADFAVPLEEKRLYINEDNEKTVNLYKLQLLVIMLFLMEMSILMMLKYQTF